MRACSSSSQVPAGVECARHGSSRVPLGKWCPLKRWGWWRAAGAGMSPAAAAQWPCRTHKRPISAPPAHRGLLPVAHLQRRRLRRSCWA